MQAEWPVVAYETLRHLVRVGVCVVLEVEVVYPVFDRERSEREETARLSRAYREAAEAFALWAMGAPAEAARAELAALGVGAAYRYDRRCVACRFRVEPSDEAGVFAVIRTVTAGRRRGGVVEQYEHSQAVCLTDNAMWAPSERYTARRRKFGKVTKKHLQ